jgi:UDP-N-acetylglucosamine 1-carboxyvinyltransferase
VQKTKRYKFYLLFLLTSELVTISNIPDIIDVNLLIELLSDLGVSVQKINANTYSFKADNIDIDFFKLFRIQK